MADIAMTSGLTMAEVAKRLDPDGSAAMIAEVATKRMEWLEYFPWVEANGLTTHRVTRRLTRPTGTWTQINQGVVPEASRAYQIEEHMAMLMDYSVIDTRLLKIQKDPTKFRRDEDLAFTIGMLEEVGRGMIYDNMVTNPEKLHGFASRPNYMLTNTGYVEDGGSGNDTTMSIWVIELGEDAVHLIYPANSRNMGIEAEDLGEETVFDNSTTWSRYRAVVTQFFFNVGVVIRDPNCVQRYANIETSGTSNIFDEDKLINCINRLNNPERAIIMANRTARAQILKNAKDKVNVHYTPDNPWGRKFITEFMGLPIVLNENLLNTEADIT